MDLTRKILISEGGLQYIDALLLKMIDRGNTDLDSILEEFFLMLRKNNGFTEGDVAVFIQIVPLRVAYLLVALKKLSLFNCGILDERMTQFEDFTQVVDYIWGKDRKSGLAKKYRCKDETLNVNTDPPNRTPVIETISSSRIIKARMPPEIYIPSNYVGHGKGEEVRIFSNRILRIKEYRLDDQDRPLLTIHKMLKPNHERLNPNKNTQYIKVWIQDIGNTKIYDKDITFISTLEPIEIHPEVGEKYLEYLVSRNRYGLTNPVLY